MLGMLHQPPVNGVLEAAAAPRKRVLPIFTRMLAYPERRASAAPVQLCEGTRTLFPDLAGFVPHITRPITDEIRSGQARNAELPGQGQ